MTTPKLTEATYCMARGCGEVATKFEADENNWHDWVWCDTHAYGRRCEPLTDAGRDALRGES